MLTIDAEKIQEWSSIGARGAFGAAMMALGEMMDDLVVLTADLSDATRVTQFKNKFPHKFYNIGIAEQNLIGIAAGMAKEGKTVFATTFAAFASMRACEQVRTNMGYMQQNVKFLGADGGVVMGTLGNTHYAVEDLAIIRAMPYLTVLSPADGLEIIKATMAAAAMKGPVYIRLTGAANNPVVYEEDYDFEIGKAVKLREGGDIAIIATGTMVYESLQAAKILKDKGLEAGIYDMHTIKPLDVQAIQEACKGARLLVTVEEHSVIGGLGSAVAEVKTAIPGAPVQMIIGLPDRFGKIGTYREQLIRYGLTGEQIAEKILNGMK